MRELLTFLFESTRSHAHYARTSRFGARGVIYRRAGGKATRNSSRREAPGAGIKAAFFFLFASRRRRACRVSHARSCASRLSGTWTGYARKTKGYSGTGCLSVLVWQKFSARAGRIESPGRFLYYRDTRLRLMGCVRRTARAWPQGRPLRHRYESMRFIYSVLASID